MNAVTQLISDAERGRWPAKHDTAAWDLLTNWAYQTACLMADKEENDTWIETMRTLNLQDLPHPEYTAHRMQALAQRLRDRKRTQARLRYDYGYRQPHRNPQLVRREGDC